jgi:MFS family permease
VAGAFVAPFALRLGASNAQIGLLSSIPALLALLITLPSGQWLGRRTRRMPYVTWSLLIYRLGFLLVVLVPFLPGEARGTILVWLIILFTAPAHFFNVGWQSMLADVVPELERARVFASRSVLSAIGLTGGLFVAGYWLEWISFPLNYQTLFLFGFLTSIVSVYYVARIRVPDSEVVPPAVELPALPALWRGSLRAFTTQPDFRRIVLNTLFYGLGLWMIGPLYVLYYVRVQGASEWWLGLNGTIGSLAPIVGNYIGRWLVMRYGENRVLKISICLVGIYPVLVGLSPNLTVVLFWTALNGLIVPSVNLSHFPQLLKICPAAERPLYLGIYSSIMNVGAFLMPLLGVAVADRVGITPLLIAGGVASIIGSTRFLWRPLETPDTLALRSIPARAEQGN